MSACGNVFKGYSIATGYMGWVPWYERYMLFTTQDEYYEYVREENEDEYSNKSNTATE
jgi:hypothetical protein